MAENLQTTQVIAKIFGVSTRRVEQLKAEGVIKGQGRPTKYDLLPTIQAYIRYLSDKANGRAKKETTAELEESKLRAEVDIKEAKAAAARLELAELQGTMHRARTWRPSRQTMYSRSGLCSWRCRASWRLTCPTYTPRRKWLSASSVSAILFLSSWLTMSTTRMNTGSA